MLMCVSMINTTSYMCSVSPWTKCGESLVHTHCGSVRKPVLTVLVLDQNCTRPFVNYVGLSQPVLKLLELYRMYRLFQASAHGIDWKLRRAHALAWCTR
jgi:hypothetical protein